MLPQPHPTRPTYLSKSKSPNIESAPPKLTPPKLSCSVAASILLEKYELSKVYLADNIKVDRCPGLSEKKENSSRDFPKV
jgi:hypothetical protein